MINEEKFKENFISAINMLGNSRKHMLLLDYEKVMQFYLHAKTGNERAFREEDTRKMDAYERLILSYAEEKGGAYFTQVKASKYNVWVLGRWLNEIKEDVIKAAKREA